MGETVTDVDFNPQETTFNKESNQKGSFMPVAIYRLDFVATIKTGNNENKKVLIEIQKTRKYLDVFRFRNYIGKHYKKMDEVVTDSGNKYVALPIITIYLLGFPLQNEAPAIKVNRENINMLTGEVITKKDDFIEKLTHDCFIVQITKIEGKLQTKLDRLLNLFEQKYFLDDTGIIKEYNYTIEKEEMKMITDMLHYACTDPESRKVIEAEREALRILYLALEEDTQELKNVIQEKDRELDKNKKTIEELVREIETLKQQINK